MSKTSRARRPKPRRPRPHRSTLQSLASAIPVAGRASAFTEPIDGSGPTDDELRAIEAEAPTFAAYLAVVEAECRFAASPDVLSRRALRRAEVALARVVAENANRAGTNDLPASSQGPNQ